MPNTYVALKTETLVSATSSVTFSLSGISGYTDLVIVSQIKATGDTNARIRFNGDTTSNYSVTNVSGSGSAAFSSRVANATGGYLDNYAQPQANFNYSHIAYIFNYANATTFKTVLSRSNNSGTGVDAAVNLWRKTPEAITSITIYSNNANTFDVGSTFSLYGIANADQGSAKATGGMITEDSTYWYHTFTSSGAFVPKQSLTCDVLLVAGGGGGGDGNGGGGGAGGVLNLTSQALTAISYNVTVGSGGNYNTNGTNSVIGALSAAIGGGGGGYGGGGPGGNGGSGGGGGYAGAGSSTGGTGTAGPPRQGYNGGSVPNGSYAVGFGGGAGSAGTTSAAGDGTSTYSSWGSITNTGQNVSGVYKYAGGGNAEYATTPPNNGGGGAGNGGNGIANTGGGGGATASYGTGGKGGSGVVIVRYLKA